MTRLNLFLGIAILGAGAYAACSKSAPEPERTSQPEPTTALPINHPPITGAASGSAPPSSGAPVEEIAWDAPKAWQSVPNTNTVRKATYKITKAAGDAEDAELTVSAAFGGSDANLKRWAGQFGNAQPKTEERTSNGVKITVVEVKGTFAGGGMMGGPPSPPTPKEKFMLLGAIIGSGERQHFFKMVGPEKTVTAAKKDFDAMVASVRLK